MNAIAHFEVQAGDPETAMRFYADVLGWGFERQEGLPIPYWRIETDGLRGGLLQRPAASPPAGCGTNAYVCSIGVPDLDATAARIERAGGQVALSKFAVPGRCWQAYFTDPEGNTFGLFQADEAAR